MTQYRYHHFVINLLHLYTALSAKAAKKQKITASATPRGGPVKGNKRNRQARSESQAMISSVTKPRVQQRTIKTSNAPSSAPQGKNRGNQSSTRIASTIATVQAIAHDSKHPKKKEAQELLNARQRGWVDDNKVREVLKTLIF